MIPDRPTPRTDPPEWALNAAARIHYLDKHCSIDEWLRRAAVRIMEEHDAAKEEM